MRPAILSTLPGYTPADLRADVLAGISVAMVALPLSLAIAIASGAPPESGLVTAVVAGFLISALGGSRVQIGGPTGAFIVVVAGVIADHGLSGLITATFMAGVILLVAGAFRAGRLIRHIPEPVIHGFTIGIAAIIALSQLKDLFGLDIADLPADAIPKIAALWQAQGSVAPAALAIGLVTMVLIVLLRRTAPALPGLIVAVAATSAAVALLDLPVETIGDRFGSLEARLPMPTLPDLSLARMQELLPSALIIAFLAGVESLLSAIVADRMAGFDPPHRPDAEILAQGWANLGSALVAGLPATGAIARTATNIRAGGRSPVAGMVHALTMLAALYLAAPLAAGLAMPALAGLLLLTAWNMAEPDKWRGHATTGPRADRLLLLATAALTVFADLTVAIGLGTAAGLALRLQRRKVRPPEWNPRDR